MPPAHERTTIVDPVSLRRSRVETAIEAVVAAAAPLAAFTDFTGRIDRRRFLAAVALAMAAIAAARAMDWLVFGAGPGAVPLFFVGIAGVALGIGVPGMAARRLRDAGGSGWSLLLVAVPLIGWAILCHRLLAPSVFIVEERA